MAYSNSYMFLGIGLFVFLSSQALANHVASVPLNYDTVVYKMPPEPPTYPEINGEALDDQKVDLEHVKAQKREDALDLNEQMAEEYVNAQKIGKALYEEKALENMIAQKLEKTLNGQTSKDQDKNTQKLEEALDEQMAAEYIKAQNFAACESPPNPLTDHKINEEALDDQKSQEYLKAQKIAACESPPNPLTDHKINEESLDNQKGQEYMKAEKYEALDDQKDLENSEAQKIAASESSKPLNGLEINESEVNWRSFHAKYPWIKRNGHKSIPGSRKLLNDIANDQLGGLSLQI